MGARCYKKQQISVIIVNLLFSDKTASCCFHRLGPLGWVGHRVAMSLCVSVIKVVIVDYGQMVHVFILFFFYIYKIEGVCMVLRILNLQGHQNCMLSLKVTTILMTFFVHD